MTEHNEDNVPTPNIPLLRKAVEWVEAEEARPLMEREWNQGNWFMVRGDEQQARGWCGTSCCVAGWVGLNSDVAQPETVMNDYGYEEFTDRMVYPNGMVVHVSDYAQAALGLTDAEADRLFGGSNTAQMIRKVAEEIAGEPL